MLSPSQKVTARRWLRHALDHGARFDVARKLQDAAACMAEFGARTFVVPSKLDSLDRTGARLLAAGFEGRPVRLGLSDVTFHDGTRRLVCSAPGCGTVGYVQRKHTAWLLPLIERGAAVYATAVTGGTLDRPSRGINVVFAGLDVALAPTSPATRASRRPAAHVAEPRARYAVRA